MSRRIVALCMLIAALAVVTAGAAGCARGPATSTEDATGSHPVTATTQLPTEGRGSSEKSPGSTTEVGPPTPSPIVLSVYYPRDDKLSVVVRQVPYTERVATTAVSELLKGPSTTDSASGFHTEIPAGTNLRSVSIRNRIATVDLTGEFDDGGGSRSMFMRLAQLVFTVTQFDSVDSVALRLDGRPVEAFSGEGIVIDHPMTREDFEDVLPAIFVETPRPGESTRSPLRLSGTANVFEAVFKAEIRDAAATVVGSKVITASSGTGTRGAFTDAVPFTVTRTQMGSLVVFAESPRDGSRIDVVTIPIKLIP